MRAVERVSLVELFRFLQFLYKNFNLEFTFPIIELSFHNSCIYLYQAQDILHLRLDNVFLAFYIEVSGVLSFLRGPKRTHSVLPKCKDN